LVGTSGIYSKGSLYNQVPKPKQPTYNDIKTISENQIEKIIATISLEALNNHFLRTRDMTILYVFLYTGVRRGELLGLRIQDIDLENESIYIRAQTSKSKKGRRIPINPILLMSLKKYLELLFKRKSRCGYLFVSSKQDTALTTHGLKNLMNKYRRLSGVKFSAHQLRQTFACALAKQNADIMSIKCALGHSSITMTERYLRSIGSENTRVFINKLSF